jgi:hypothetical protein
MMNRKKKEEDVHIKRTFISSNSRWNRVEPLVRSYMISILLLLEHLTGEELLNYVLKHLENLVVYLSMFDQLSAKFLKVFIIQIRLLILYIYIYRSYYLYGETKEMKLKLEHSLYYEG